MTETPQKQLTPARGAAPQSRRPRALALALALVLALTLSSTAEGSWLSDVKEFFFGSESESEIAGTLSNNKKKSERPKPQPPHAEGLVIADYSDMSLNKVMQGGRVVDLVSGLHFDSILQDSPDEIRPASVVAFFDSNDEKCLKEYKALNWMNLVETKLPARELLFASRYDMHAAPRRAWYKFTPEMDLAKRFGVTQCPEIVFVPRSCNGWTEWCSRGADPEDTDVELIGCADFKEQCTNTIKWNGKGDLTSWIKDHIQSEGRPKLSKYLGTYKDQNLWLRRREETTTSTMLRNLYLAQAFPAFTPRGFKAMPVPQEFMKFLTDFVDRHKNAKRTEHWEAASTQMSFHETPTDFTDLDRERAYANRMANQYIKPLVEEWSQMGDLELTAFYGVRHYKHGNWLRSHIDRIDSHVLSVTITVAKGPFEGNAAWPLEVVDWNGDHVRYEHPAGSMVLYESSKLPHGRPYPNQGGEHLGAFIHFKPRSAGADMNRRWDDIARVARAHQAGFTSYKNYKQTSIIDPDPATIEYASKRFGEGTNWKPVGKRSASNDDDDDDEKVSNGSFAVDFKNGADRPLDLHWVRPDGGKVLQGTLGRGTQMTVTTFRGHRFAFTEKGGDKALPDGVFTMEAGRSIVKYSLTQAGTPRNPETKFADKVRERIKLE
ncbi:Hypothetical Protein FCC1311_021902 [Hondaea fermentalgiana]|uniref:Fe2OG dioxygenase domain-containing protein n=1 Tax=Hondaea fermentalgiana TaxID=2315210 RepID=A0A2R5G4Q8_9STRA|nr:Hypothetical Protein FCC1311_021902 [Hondaea fermentalgiana]|eukprot:GBG25970.1 Hypothetical Protein FCC1311_021902 [Hondaea fermentalgiana]